MKIHPHRIRSCDIVATFRRLWYGISFYKIFQECNAYALPPSNWQTELLLLALWAYVLFKCSTGFNLVSRFSSKIALSWKFHWKYVFQWKLKLEFSLQLPITMLDERASIQAVNFICSMQKFTLNMWINTIWISYEMDQRPIFNSLE